MTGVTVINKPFKPAILLKKIVLRTKVINKGVINNRIVLLLCLFCAGFSPVNANTEQSDTIVWDKQKRVILSHPQYGEILGVNFGTHIPSNLVIRDSLSKARKHVFIKAIKLYFDNSNNYLLIRRDSGYFSSRHQSVTIDYAPKIVEMSVTLSDNTTIKKLISFKHPFPANLEKDNKVHQQSKLAAKMHFNSILKDEPLETSAVLMDTFAFSANCTSNPKLGAIRDMLITEIRGGVLTRPKQSLISELKTNLNAYELSQSHMQEFRTKRMLKSKMKLVCVTEKNMRTRYEKNIVFKPMIDEGF